MIAFLHARRIALAAFVTVAFAACGGSTVETPVDPGTDTGSSGDTGSGGDATDGSGDESTPIDGTPTDGTPTDGTPTDSPADGDAAKPACNAPGTTRAACTKCCGDEHPEGLKTFEAAVIGCACGDAVCKTQCSATACASPPTKPGDVCSACIRASLTTTKDGGPDGACVAPVKAACSASAKCVAYATCLGTCPGG